VSLVMVSVSVSVKLQGTQAERRRTARPAVLAGMTCAISLTSPEAARRGPVRPLHEPQMKGPRHRRLSCLYDHARPPAPASARQRPPAPASDTMRQGATDRFTDIFTDITTDRP